MPTRKSNLYSVLSRLCRNGLKRSNHNLVPHLLHSNLPPSDSERAAVCNIVAVVQEEIARLQCKPDFLQHRRRRLSQCTELLRVHSAVLSPIRWVPTEVLEQIFQYCTWKYTPGRDCHWQELPWAISQVCRAWRDITLNLPFLWNRLPIHLRNDTWPNLDGAATFLKTLLERSRNAPLHLYIYAPFKEYDWHPLINVVVLHSERVQELMIQSSSITMQAFQKIKGRLPLLRKLTLSKVSRPVQAGALIIDIFEDAPLLREATFVRLYTHELMLPWSQLISFNGHKINRTGLCQVVANSLNLNRLEITGHSYGAGPKTVTLCHLISLKVKLENPVINSNFFFGSLNLPIVEEIEVEEYQGELFSHLTTMLSRCPAASVLRKLVLRTVVQGPGSLISLLRFTPRLSELDIELPPLHDLLDLIIDQENAAVVPMLQKLTVHVTAGDEWRKEIPMTSLARSRCEIDMLPTGGSFLPSERRRLKSFRLVFPDSAVCHMAQAELNGWLEDPESTDRLISWRHMLHEELPELDYKPPPLKRAFDLKFGHRLDRLLGAIENFQLMDVKVLYVCIYSYVMFIPIIIFLIYYPIGITLAFVSAPSELYPS